MASPKTEEAEFWESLENTFGRKIPVDPQVRYVINMAIKESRNQDPEEREKVINAAVYLAQDIVTVAYRDESDAAVALEAKNAAQKFIHGKLKERVPSVKETESKAETKQTTEGAKTAGDFIEQLSGFKKLEKKGEPKEKPKEEEDADYAVIKGVINIYQGIIEKFVEENKKKMFKGYDYQTLIKTKNCRLHSLTGLPTFRGGEHRSCSIIIDYLKKHIEQFKVYLPMGETHHRECNETFDKARDELLREATDSMFYAFKKFESTTDVEKTDVKKLVRKQLLEDPKIKELGQIIKELGQKIKDIIYSDLKRVFVDSQALTLWEGKQKEFDEFGKMVENMFKKLPKFVVYWGGWAYAVSKKLGPEASSVE